MQSEQSEETHQNLSRLKVCVILGFFSRPVWAVYCTMLLADLGAEVSRSSGPV